MAYSNLGFATGTVASGSPLTVSIDGAPADFISVVNDNTTFEVTLDLNPDRGDDGVPITIREDSILTINPGSIYGFTISLGGVGTSGTIDVYWW